MVKFNWRRPVVRWSRVEGETFSLESSLDQTIQALELASAHAARSNNSEDLTNAAHGWMRLTETIHALTQQAKQEGSEQEPAQPGMGFGFRAPEEPRSVTIEEDEPLAEG